MLMTAILEYTGEALLLMWSIAFVLLALRVGRLRDLGRAPKAPPTGRFLLGAGWAFLFSSQYKDVSDVTTHMLVLTARTLVALAAMVVIVLILLSSR
jgi:hypothetical protein